VQVHTDPNTHAALQASSRELRTDMSAFKAQYAGMTTAATRTMESWARSELNAVNARLGDSIATCSKQQELLAAQMELLRNQVRPDALRCCEQLQCSSLPGCK
jgi:hypothetical protein